nr:MAG TPA: hypothetical protein [Caudoviricetes sp.]
MRLYREPLILHKYHLNSVLFCRILCRMPFALTILPPGQRT